MAKLRVSSAPDLLERHEGHHSSGDTGAGLQESEREEHEVEEEDESEGERGDVGDEQQEHDVLQSVEAEEDGVREEVAVTAADAVEKEQFHERSLRDGEQQVVDEVGDAVGVGMVRGVHAVIVAVDGGVVEQLLVGEHALENQRRDGELCERGRKRRRKWRWSSR